MTVDASARRRGWRVVALAAMMAAVPALRAQPVDAEPASFAYTVQARDTLIGLSRQLLIDPTNWPALARFNRLRDPNLLQPGSTLRIPLSWLRSEPVPASVLSSSGAVRQSGAGAGAGAAPAPGGSVAEGETLSTGADGNLSVRLVDGSVLRLRANSELLLRDSRRFPGAGQVRSAVQVRDGRIEVKSPASVGGQPGFQVTTPQGVLSVRGTEFRVAVQSARQRTLGEVLEGAVAVDGIGGGAGQRLEAGFGTQVDAAGRVEAPTRLLPAPALDGVATLHERPLVVFEWPALSGAAAYRAQVAGDAAFERVVAELSVDAPLLRVAGLPDGDYWLRLRGADAAGLEGRNAERRFTLKARPEPPLPRQPAPRAQIIGAVDFAWTANPEARGYRWQLAADPQFTAVLDERRGLDAPRLRIESLPPGRYHWRLASERSETDGGPWGDPSTFDVRPTPPPAPPPRSEVRDDGVSLSWPGQPGQHFDLEIARDMAFARDRIELHLSAPRLDFAPPGPGRYYLRLRVREADGYVGAWGEAQFFEVPSCLRTAQGNCWRTQGEPVLQRQ